MRARHTVATLRLGRAGHKSAVPRQRATAALTSLGEEGTDDGVEHLHARVERCGDLAHVLVQVGDLDLDLGGRRVHWGEGGVAGACTAAHKAVEAANECAMGWSVLTGSFLMLPHQLCDCRDRSCWSHHRCSCTEAHPLALTLGSVMPWWNSW